MSRPGSAPAEQSGAVALASVIVLLGLVSFITLGLVISVVGEQRSLASEARSQWAAMLADSAMDQALAYLKRNAWSMTGQGNASSPPASWSPCSSAALAPPCGDGARNLYNENWIAFANAPVLRASSSGSSRAHYLARVVGGIAAFEVITIFVESTAPDGIGRARQRLSVRLSSRVSAIAAAPLMANGALRVEDDVSVVVDDALGRPRSLWTSGNARFVAAARSCMRNEYLASAAAGSAACTECRCPDGAERLLSTAMTEQADVFDRDGHVGANPDTTGYVSDPLLQFFGVSLAKAHLLRSEATSIESCASLGTADSGLFWIDGDCSIPAERIVGSASRPIVLMISAGRLRLQQASRIHALVIMLPAPGEAAQLELSSSAVLDGALASSGAMTVSGAGTVFHDVPLLRELTKPTDGLIALNPIPGSWRDW